MVKSVKSWPRESPNLIKPLGQWTPPDDRPHEASVKIPTLPHAASVKNTHAASVKNTHSNPRI